MAVLYVRLLCLHEACAMKLEKGDMWDVFGKTDLFLITTNPIRRKDGAIVMGRGIAKEVKDRFPEFPYDFGRRFSPEFMGYQSMTPTGVVGRYDGQLMGYFMVKTHWRDEARLDVIDDSVIDLSETAPHYDRIDLNFPGIGNGKLKREDVLPIIEQLPDNVHVWEYN